MLTRTRLRRIAPPGAALALAAALAACAPADAPGDAGKKAAGPAGMPPPPQVTVVTVAPRNVPVLFEYVGRLEPSREVEIRARVGGIVESRSFEEGAAVRAGQVLYRIDPAPFEARVKAAEADLAEARARLAQAERELARLAPLLADRAVAQREVDDARSAAELSRAAVQGAQSRLEQARLDLSWTSVTAPVSGLIGRALVVEGALVQAGSGGPMTTLAQIDPIYVRFAVPENEQLRLQREMAQGALRMPGRQAADVGLELADGSLYPRKGRVNFTDYRANAQTGAFELRASVPNPQGELKPGQFVRVRLGGSVRPEAIAIPQRAVQEGAAGKYVYVIGKGQGGMAVAEPRPVEVGDWTLGQGDGGRAENLWLIRKGLAAGDQVIVEGVARIFFPGMPVQPVAAGAAPGAAPGKGPPGNGAAGKGAPAEGVPGKGAAK